MRNDAVLADFLSDLCGREGAINITINAPAFLSDLCGREVGWHTTGLVYKFLSDLCGREVAKLYAMF